MLTSGDTDAMVTAAHPAGAAASEDAGCAWADELRRRLSADAVVVAREPMARRTTLGVGGPADVYVEPAGETDLAQVRQYCRERAVPFRVVGRGSNLLVRDGGIRGVVVGLHHASFSRVDVEADRVSAGAGARLKLVAIAARRGGLTGLEFLEGIPGSVGGALRMNAGAYAAWTFDRIESVRYMTPEGAVGETPASAVPAQYRSCPFFADHIALAATFRGEPAAAEVIRARMDEFSRRRWATQPRQSSAGCIFKNPPTIPAGRLIDELGLKGAQVGGAEVSTVHANFMVNTGGATAADFLELITRVRERARMVAGLELETEVEIVGED